ncbi:hypothetical protein N7519_000538 [Penicillium mononematosum]|uniref:uncharacterized protein n=1 Tax=Penicillium mononematosum TaxID=268346 RepID=UPI0025486BB9|nr:uncharacterized protein N7519_000538 [Penicillium mononematosum]KAJ6190517.1 hypothetical protein N7519_000538 [Penicillium mononematosum]
MFLGTVLYGVLLSSLSFAMTPENACPGGQDVSAELLTNLTLFSEYCAAATCPTNFNSKGTRVVCDPGVCPTLEQTDTTIISGFKGLKPGDTTGFLALDRTNKMIVLSFRGTRTPGNIVTDLEYQQVPIDEICPNCQVHRGFYYAWGNFSQFIMPGIDQVAAEYPDYSIVFTGHSLGGALATFGAVLEGSANRPIDLYTFGCPQLGNYSFSEFVSGRTLGTGWRVTHTDDPVPRLLSTTAMITSPNCAPVTTTDIKVFAGIDNKSGNLGQTTLDFAAHNWYIGNMKGCSME